MSEKISETSELFEIISDFGGKTSPNFPASSGQEAQKQRIAIWGRSRCAEGTKQGGRRMWRAP
jgi:hypothetical protein